MHAVRRGVALPPTQRARIEGRVEVEATTGSHTLWRLPSKDHSDIGTLGRFLGFHALAAHTSKRD